METAGVNAYVSAGRCSAGTMPGSIFEEYMMKNRKRRSGILPIDEHEELLQDLDDLRVIALRKSEPTIPLAEVKRRLKKIKD